MRSVLLILPAAIATPQEDHSQHQHAVGGLGTVAFWTSCDDATQKWISPGPALLHSFGYEEARLAFYNAAIRKAIPATGDYDWSGSIGAQHEAATALVAWAEGNKADGIRLLRVAAGHEDAIDKHPVTPGALLPVREMLADLLLEMC